MGDRIELVNERLHAEIDPVGAELRRLATREGLELLWPGDPQLWDRSAPLLFPVIGRVRDGQVRWGDRWYDMPAHGFAMHERFDLEARISSSCRWTLRASPRTRASYPFDFELAVDYRLEGSALSMRVTVVNAGEGPMPLSIGLHPGLRWPIRATSREAHWIEFEAHEPAPVRRPDPVTRLLGPRGVAVPLDGRRLQLRDDSFDAGALVLDSVASRSVRLGDAKGPAVALHWHGFDQLALWSLPGAGFVCIEPWLGLPDLHVSAATPQPSHDAGITLAARHRLCVGLRIAIEPDSTPRR